MFHTIKAADVETLIVKLHLVLRNAVSLAVRQPPLLGCPPAVQSIVTVLLCTGSKGNDQHGIVQLVTTLDSSNEKDWLQTAARVLTTTVLLRHSCIVTFDT